MGKKGGQTVERTVFSLVDVIRIIGGLLFLNAFASWWFTSTSTWGYEGKWVDSRYLYFQLAGSYTNFTEHQLAQFNGSDPQAPIYIGINGSVYDVTAGRSMYGPKGSYRKLAGKDCARVYVTGCLMKADEYTHDLRGLQPHEVQEQLGSWQKYYGEHPKYWYVGQVVHEPLEGRRIPEPCEHMRRPGNI